MYDYQKERPNIFTEEGVERLTKVRKHVEKCLALAGAVRMEEATSTVGGDTWGQLAYVDYMVEKGELREVICQEKPPGQYRIFVKG